jgi:undecaprenyl diphosphate synthase
VQKTTGSELVMAQITTSTENSVPKHIAIIMDGNGRWAKARGYPRFYGHIRGTSRVKEIVTEAKNIGVKALTLYAFSTENWKRPEQELSVLWKLLRKYLRREVKDMKKNGIRLNIIGDLTRFPEDVKAEVATAVEFLKDGNSLQLTFALSYGGRTEILQATQEIAEQVKRGEIAPEQITEELMNEHLYTRYLGANSDVDFMIRTSGEQRISNYLLWQCSYAEFEFPETLWPDYTVEEFRKSLEDFRNRQRRFGGI